MAFNPSNLNWAALASLASGNTVGEQLGNANNVMAGQAEKAQALNAENATKAWLTKTFPGEDFSQFSGPALAQAFNYGLQRHAQAQQPKSAEFKQLDDGTYGAWDGKSFNVLGTAPKPAALPPIAEEYNWAKQNGFDGTPQDYQVWKSSLSKQKGMIIESDGNGGFRVVQGDVDTSKMPKLTEAEGRNAGFLQRALSAEKELSALEGEGKSLWNKTAGSIPVAGNYLKSADAQKFDQAQRNFINAVLRRESGAVISPEEFDNARIQYFPQPGDGPEVIEQKRKNRQDAIEGFRISSGPAANIVQGNQQPGSVDDLIEKYRSK